MATPWRQVSRDEFQQSLVRARTFRAFDKDGSGAIEDEEFSAMCRTMDPTMSEGDIAKALLAMDHECVPLSPMLRVRIVALSGCVTLESYYLDLVS